jgi:hypothetical protein
MIISDLDYWQRFSRQQKVLGGVEVTSSGFHIFMDESLYADTQHLSSANSIGRNAMASVTGFSMIGMSGDGSLQSASGATSQASSGNLDS